MVEQPNNKWHLDKRVSVGHLITTLAMVGAAALWMLRLEGRLDLVDQRDQQIVQRIERIDIERRSRDNEIIDRLEVIQSTLAAHERSSTAKHGIQ